MWKLTVAFCSVSKHSVYYNPVNNQTSAIPRHREINDFLVRKICRDLGVPEP